MDKIVDWIKIGTMVIGFLATIGIFIFQSFVTRQEMNARFDAVQRQLDEARGERKEIRSWLKQLNQNHINHLTHHDKQN